MADMQTEEYGRLYPEEEQMTFPDPCIALRNMSHAIRADIETNPGYLDEERIVLFDALLKPEGAPEPITELGRLVLMASEVKPVMGRVVAGPDGSKLRPARNGDRSSMLRSVAPGKATRVMVKNVEPMSLRERGITPKTISPIVIAACKRILHTPSSGRSASEEAANRHRRAGSLAWKPLLGAYARPVVALFTKYETNTAYFIDEIMRKTVHNGMEGYLEVLEGAPILGYTPETVESTEHVNHRPARSRNWFGVRSPA